MDDLGVVPLFLETSIFVYNFRNYWLEGTQVEVVSDLPRSEYTYEDVEGEAPLFGIPWKVVVVFSGGAMGQQQLVLNKFPKKPTGLIPSFLGLKKPL